MASHPNLTGEIGLPVPGLRTAVSTPRRPAAGRRAQRLRKGRRVKRAVSGVKKFGAKLGIGGGT